MFYLNFLNQFYSIDLYDQYFIDIYLNYRCNIDFRWFYNIIRMSYNYFDLLVYDALNRAFHFYIYDTNIYDRYFYNRYFYFNDKSMSAYRALIY